MSSVQKPEETNKPKSVGLEAKRERLFYNLHSVVPALTKSQMSVAMCIGYHLNRDTYQAWPGMRRLAKKLRLGTGTVWRAVKALVEREVLQVRRGNAFYANRYRFHERMFAELSDDKNILDELKREIFMVAGEHYGERGCSVVAAALEAGPALSQDVHSALMNAVENGEDISQLATTLWHLVNT